MAAGLGEVSRLVEVLASAQPVYQRWWDHPLRHATARIVPWSAEDQARLERLAGADPANLTDSARRLLGVAAELREISRLVGDAAGGGTFGPAGERCAEIAAGIEGRADQADALAGDLRAAANRLELVLAEVGEQLRRALADLTDPGSSRPAARADDRGAATWAGDPSTPAWTDDRGAAVGGAPEWSALDALVQRHAGALRGLRAALTSADPADPAGPGGPWRVDNPADWWGEPGPAPTATHEWGGNPDLGIWAGDRPPPAHTVVVDDGYVQRVAERWRPLTEVPARPVEPGAGPALPGTESEPVGTDLGVQLPALPDVPPRTARRRRNAGGPH